MSFTKRAYYFSKSLSEFLRKKSTKNSMFLTLTFFFCIGFVLNAYAYDPVDIYKEVDEMSSSSTTIQGKHSHKSQGFQIADTTTNLLDLTYPQGNENFETHILNNPNLSPGAKLGLLGSTGVAVNAVLYNPPQIDVVEHLAMEWVPNYKESTGGTVYASSGFERLQDSGIVGLWQIVRNIAYTLFVVVFIVAGFMIMFRHKLGGQTMVTIYNTLPGIIIGLILVTFSFAIVGIIMDIGTFLIGVITNLLSIRTTLGHDAVDPTKPLGTWSTYSVQVGDRLLYGGGLPQLIDGWMALLGWVVQQVLSKLIGGLATLVMSIIIAYASIKIFITLLKAYVGILFDTILAPMVIAIGTIPGRQGMTKDWLNRIFKNVGVFVLVFLLIHLPLHLWQYGYEFDLFGGNLGSDDGLFIGELQIVQNIVMASVGIYMLFMAGNAPKLLEPLFPQTGGKGGAGAAEGAGRDLSKIPGIGGFFKQ